MDRLHRSASSALDAVLTRREVFWNAFLAGLAAPTMLFTARSAYVVYDNAGGLANAWAEPGKQLTEGLNADPK